MISIGIDISKEKSTVCILRPYGEVVASPYEITHTEEGLATLIKKIRSLKDETRVVLEATGTYHLPVLISLKQSGIFVSVINPLLMKKYASAVIRKGKTDKLDSVRIANYGIDNWFHLVDYQPLENTYHELKILGRQYFHYLKLKINSKLAPTPCMERTMVYSFKFVAIICICVRIFCRVLHISRRTLADSNTSILVDGVLEDKVGIPFRAIE